MGALRYWLLLATAVAAWSWTAAAAGQTAPSTAPTGSEIVFGMSTALSGPTADLGINMRDGMLLAFAQSNARGGIHGRALRLVALDDGYEPARTAPNMRALVADPHVVGIVGNVGTPTAVAAVPIAHEAGVVFYGAFTGAGLLRRDPPDRWVVNFRASYAEETAAMIDALIDKAHLKPQEIAFFSQHDSFGDAGFAGGIAALKRHGLKDTSTIVSVRYERNTAAVEGPLADLLLTAPAPRAVVMIGAYAPCAAFIRQARAHGVTALFLNVSFVGAESLAHNLGKEADGVIVTQVVPDYWSDLPLAVEYRKALEQCGQGRAPSFVALEGYAAGRVLCRALENIPGAPDRPGVLAALEGLGKFDMGLGADLELSAARRQASHAVWPTVIRGGRVRAATWDELMAGISEAAVHD